MSLATRLTKLEAARPKSRDTWLDLYNLSPRALDVLAKSYGRSLTCDHPGAFLDTLRANLEAAKAEGRLDPAHLSLADMAALVDLWEAMAL